MIGVRKNERMPHQPPKRVTVVIDPNCSRTQRAHRWPFTARCSRSRTRPMFCWNST
jgi:hypothetical protein